MEQSYIKIKRGYFLFIQVAIFKRKEEIHHYFWNKEGFLSIKFNMKKGHGLSCPTESHIVFWLYQTNISIKCYTI